jgi:hypothetical protein
LQIFLIVSDQKNQVLIIITKLRILLQAKYCKLHLEDKILTLLNNVFILTMKQWLYQILVLLQHAQMVNAFSPLVETIMEFTP